MTNGEGVGLNKCVYFFPLLFGPDMWPKSSVALSVMLSFLRKIIIFCKTLSLFSYMFEMNFNQSKSNQDIEGGHSVWPALSSWCCWSLCERQAPRPCPLWGRHAETVAVGAEADWEEDRASAPPGGFNPNHTTHTCTHAKAARDTETH